jgi:hypothetical protein
MIDLATIKSDFECDGSVRDIYIMHCTLDDWAKTYEVLAEWPRSEFFVDDIAQPPPSRVEDVFALIEKSAALLRVRVGNSVVNAHFFWAEEIECDIDPREVTSQAGLDALLDFIRQLGDATGKRFMLSPENLPESPFLSYWPQTNCFELHTTAR